MDSIISDLNGKREGDEPSTVLSQMWVEQPTEVGLGVTRGVQ